LLVVPHFPISVPTIPFEVSVYPAPFLLNIGPKKKGGVSSFLCSIHCNGKLLIRLTVEVGERELLGTPEAILAEPPNLKVKRKMFTFKSCKNPSPHPLWGGASLAIFFLGGGGTQLTALSLLSSFLRYTLISFHL
jgi:hypothetical protein